MLEDASYENDEERLHEEAKNSNVDAQSNIAFMYLLGSDGVVMDWKKSGLLVQESNSTRRYGFDVYIELELRRWYKGTFFEATIR